MPVRARPLSPHLDVYRWQISNTLSILHRVTGVGLSVGLLALAYWFVALSQGEASYGTAARVFHSPLGLACLFAWSFAFFYHFLNGIRHLFWDAGLGFERPQRHLSGWAVVCGSIVATLGSWIAFVARRRAVSLRSPLGRVLGAGSAKAGTEHWWAERVSSVALLPLTAWFVYSLMRLPALDYATVKTWLSSPVASLLAVLLVAACTHHSLLGVQVVVEDYVPTTGTRVMSLMLLRFLHVLVGGAAIFAILHVAFGS